MIAFTLQVEPLALLAAMAALATGFVFMAARRLRATRTAATGDTA